jgi:hypothetical protein
VIVFLGVCAILLSVFGGIGIVVGTVGGMILIAEGKLTLPGTNMRKLQHEKVELEILRFAVQRESAQAELDGVLNLRRDRALESSSLFQERGN